MGSVKLSPNKSNFRSGDTITLRVYVYSIVVTNDEMEGWYWSISWGGREGIFNAVGEVVTDLFTSVGTNVILDESISIGEGCSLSNWIADYVFTVNDSTPVGYYFLRSQRFSGLMPPPEA
jgi:hypothetical protein